MIKLFKEQKKRIQELEKLSDKELLNIIKKGNSNASIGVKILLKRGFTEEQIKNKILSEDFFQAADELNKMKTKFD